MGFMRKSKKEISHLGHKVKKVSHSVSRKAPAVLSELGKDMVVAGKVGELASGALAMAGQEELAVPLLGASEALKYGGKATQGAGKAVGKANKGDYVGAVAEIEKTAVQAKKDKSTFDKNKQKRTSKLNK